MIVNGAKQGVAKILMWVRMGAEIMFTKTSLANIFILGLLEFCKHGNTKNFKKKTSIASLLYRFLVVYSKHLKSG